jgi:hypothetical protein
VVLRTALILALIALTAAVWLETWLDVRSKIRAEHAGQRIIGKVVSLGNSMRPDIEVEQGVEFAPPATDQTRPEWRTLEMENEENLRAYRRYEFLIDPVTKRARLARLRFTPLLLVLLGLAYLSVAGGLYYATSSRITGREGLLQASQPGAWSYFCDPPWHEPAAVSVRSTVMGAALWGLGAAVGVFGFVMLWTSRAGTLFGRVGISSIALFLAIVFSVLTLNRATYRIEVDSNGVREFSAVGWKMTPWSMLRGAVDETVHTPSRSHTRQPMTPSSTTHRVYFTDDQGEDIISIDDDMAPEQSQALVTYILNRTGLKLKKRRIEKK